MGRHRYGGMLVRLYATRYPSEVTGLVLVDSSPKNVEALRALPAHIAAGRAPGPSVP